MSTYVENIQINHLNKADRSVTVGRLHPGRLCHAFLDLFNYIFLNFTASCMYKYMVRYSNSWLYITPIHRSNIKIETIFIARKKCTSYLTEKSSEQKASHVNLSNFLISTHRCGAPCMCREGGNFLTAFNK
jgi:hypothetical protein